MHTLSRLATVLVAGFVLSAPALAEKGKAFATVNGQSIPNSVYEAFSGEQKAQGTDISAPEIQAAIKEELVRREVLAQEAKKRGLDKSAVIQGQMELARQAVLIRTLLSEHVRANPVSEAQLRAEYDAIKASLGNTEYKARHVLVENEDQARAIIDKLGKGEKFADLAKQSKDPGSRDNGGELGWSSPSAYVKPFADALGQLKKGEYTRTPVRTDFGYHVIQLDDTRALTPPPFDQLKPQLQQRANQQTVEKLVKELRAKAKVN